jgi:Histidine kinase-, DNA gyrase B-, and HSP90-like ATPase
MTTRLLDHADGRPTKAFFADMLTRDIELKDAVLDLLDNCVDGLMRSIPTNKLKGEKPYASHWAKLTFSRDRFIIEDNCGGIDKALARNSAFRMGRTSLDLATHKSIPTVGTYGIGMKRAIFKMGRSAVVSSVTKTDAFKVVIPPTWFKDEENWSLALQPIPRTSKTFGTRIEVTDLRSTIARQFAINAAFELDFVKLVSEQFALIIQKGFEVSVNGRRVKPKPFRIVSVALQGYTGGVAPFLFKGSFNDVEIDLSVGFYKPVPDPNELDEEDDDAGTFSSDESGWTVICNDRVVLSHDTTTLSGWGVSGVPSFHNQFIAIAGMVRFVSNDASKLPLTTTKRGIDLNNELYLRIRDKMQEGTKFFTSYTNKLKKDPDMRRKIFKETAAVDVRSFDGAKATASLKWKADRKLDGGKTFVPTMPAMKADTMKVLRFSREREQVKAVAMLLFDDPNVSAADVGGACFDHFVPRAVKR